ncbi:hypothetical protein COCSADRAFT_35365 [Bipolaris sorokiniana ND90Pr]|uniref:Uncharacterized protein n=1 Tax=Cochliobolus sativus (strain ND90Pr / ATCC 201652) TaxID=665912 RepID=M2T7T9_COCSN|nr:uncharacterized protein COCSADRAFT_35365 [Bipolaris sorokiniana ND90Pr]EMD65301.1 hypothetical protein COCSADRAFT_35365 [Bipolaris sorokiniana ND90Pr]
MTSPSEKLLKNLCVWFNDEFVGHRNWGFTIYCTGYGPSSDQQWQKLLQTIQVKAHEGALDRTETTEQDPGFQQIWSLFRLDARSDPALASLGIDRLRDLYNHGEGGQPMNTDYKLHRIFLFADDEVLSDPAGSIVKCVDADYRVEDYIPRNTRMGGQRYFGWMPMRAGSVAELWFQLDTWELERIAPLTIGGSHLVIWDGDHW